MNNFIKKIYRKIFAPHRILLDDINVNNIEKIQNKILKKIKKKEIITVAFFVSTASKWKYESIYKLMLIDKKFEPIIIVVPMFAWGKEFMISEMDTTYTWFKEKDYNVIRTYDLNTNKFFNVKTKIKPDIVFYSEPYNFVGKKYYITNFYKVSLCCHVQYAFMSDNNYQAFYNLPFHNMLWAFFAETKMHKEFSEQFALNKGKNVVVTGYPHCDNFLDENYQPKNVWEKANKNMKRVIWAPHHTIDDEGWSTFLYNYQYMLDITKNYKEQVFFTFKPHPNLKPMLYQHKDWGKHKTDAYYAAWESMSNTQIKTDDYVDLFLTSDALIHDCGSFIQEYIFTKKPAIFLYGNKDFINQWNKIGKMALDVLYKSFSYNDTVNFIENVVLKENDYKKIDRLKYLEEFLIPPNKKMASYNIYEHLNNIFNLE